MNCQKGGCYKTTNNKYFNCPPRMDDGRHFTDYRPNCHLENVVRENNHIFNSFQYRMFLMHNADKIMDINRKYACDMNCCGPCDNKQTIAKSCISGETWGTAPDMCPQMSMSQSDNQSSYSCCSTVNDSNNYYPNQNLGKNVVVNRLSSPSGGVMLSGGDPRRAYQS